MSKAPSAWHSTRHLCRPSLQRCLSQRSCIAGKNQGVPKARSRPVAYSAYAEPASQDDLSHFSCFSSCNFILSLVLQPRPLKFLQQCFALLLQRGPWARLIEYFSTKLSGGGERKAGGPQTKTNSQGKARNRLGTRRTQSQGQLAPEKQSIPVPALGQSWFDGTPGRSYDPFSQPKACQPVSSFLSTQGNFLLIISPQASHLVLLL